MKLKLWWYAHLAACFQWLEQFAAEGYRKTNLCEKCGKPSYYSRPCVER
jgi:hypothetical protein